MCRGKALAARIRPGHSFHSLSPTVNPDQAAALAAKAVAGDNPEGRLMQDAVGVDNGLTGRTA